MLLLLLRRHGGPAASPHRLELLPSPSPPCRRLPAGDGGPVACPIICMPSPVFTCVFPAPPTLQTAPRWRRRTPNHLYLVPCHQLCVPCPTHTADGSPLETAGLPQRQLGTGGGPAGLGGQGLGQGMVPHFVENLLAVRAGFPDVSAWRCSSAPTRAISRGQWWQWSKVCLGRFHPCPAALREAAVPQGP